MTTIVPKTFMRCTPLLASALVATVVLAADADTQKYSIAEGTFQPTWESLKQYQCPEWFRDAKFGIWAHWGVQCVPEQGDWYAWHMYRPGDREFQYHLEHYGHPSQFGLKDLCNAWKAEKWDPERLIQLYKRAGAKYFVAMANHHDNFDNWDSKYQPWNSVNVGPKKDLIGIWAKTARKEGLRFGVTVHNARAWDWLEAAHGSDKDGPMKGVPYDGALTKADGKGQWWEGLDPADLYGPHGAARTPAARKAYEVKWFNRTKDLVDKYRPDLLYFDDVWLPLGEAGTNIAAHYYNANLQWHDGKQEAVLNSKRAQAGCRSAVVLDIERGSRDALDEHPWQTDTCIGDWHYKRGIGYKSAKEVVGILVDVVSKNGNLLLNIPVRGDGTIDDRECQILEDLASWMAVNSECIFGTRPWKVYGEGPARKVGNVLKEDRFFNGRDVANVRFTTKGDVLYAISLHWPADRKLVIRSLAASQDRSAGVVSSVSLLGCNEKLQWSRTNAGLAVTMPEKKPCDHAYALKIIGQGLAPVASKDASIGPGSDGRILLGAVTASIHGSSPQFHPGKGDDKIGTIGDCWNDWCDWVSWEAKLAKPGKYTVQVAYFCADRLSGSEFTVSVGGKILNGKVGPTGPTGDGLKTETLGTINVKRAGLQIVRFQPKTGKWCPGIELRSVVLAPAD